MGVDIPAPMSHMGTPSDSGSATGLLASVDAALSGQTKELAAEQAGQEQRPLVASTAAAGEDFDFHAHFGFSAPTSEEQQEVQEQGQVQDADQTAQDSADDAADEWLRQIQMRAKGVSKEMPKGQQPQELPDCNSHRSGSTYVPPFVYLGRNVKRYFDGYGLFLGRVTAFTPAAMNEDGVDLWTVVYEDDDEEQLTRDEVDESISLFESGIVPTTAEAPEERESEENEVEEEEEEAEKEDDDEEEEEEEEEEENPEGGRRRKRRTCTGTAARSKGYFVTARGD